MGPSCGSICVSSENYQYTYFRTTPSTYLGPTTPITWPLTTDSPTTTKKLGLQWQYEYFTSPLLKLLSVKVIVKPPPPKKPTNEIVPSVTATNSKPSGAPISIPLWYVDAPPAGAFLLPKYEFILVIPGAGHKSEPSSSKSIIWELLLVVFWGIKSIEIRMVKIIMI